ncbi:hypothetical protein EDWATA_03372 [Edwardsiella tarda ATCC 23685]|uniref:Uncharacterized protein n=1 Tax=Edwardsiella tarda ATCC 23685 TaxID=500638 RepID=D4F9B4_EDWTA|nr:hypothetical protein EDWATA_03372 [Edwardsiella tarda ATCC 23685]
MRSPGFPGRAPLWRNVNQGQAGKYLFAKKRQGSASGGVALPIEHGYE